MKVTRQVIQKKRHTVRFAGGGSGQVGRKEEAKHVAEQNVSGNQPGPTQL